MNAMVGFVFTFGKHKGRSLRDVLSDSPSYIHWCTCKMAWFKIMLKRDDPQVFDALKKAETALRDEEEAWAWGGGRHMPTYDDVFRKVYKPNMKAEAER